MWLSNLEYHIFFLISFLTVIHTTLILHSHSLLGNLQWNCILATTLAEHTFSSCIHFSSLLCKPQTNLSCSSNYTKRCLFAPNKIFQANYAYVSSCAFRIKSVFRCMRLHRRMHFASIKPILLPSNDKYFRSVRSYIQVLCARTMKYVCSKAKQNTTLNCKKTGAFFFSFIVLVVERFFLSQRIRLKIVEIKGAEEDGMNERDAEYEGEEKVQKGCTFLYINIFHFFLSVLFCSMSYPNLSLRSKSHACKYFDYKSRGTNKNKSCTRNFIAQHSALAQSTCTLMKTHEWSGLRAKSTK